MEHTADWALRVWAADLPSLLVEAARGMYHLMGAVPGAPAGEIRLEVDGIDAETLLVSFLSEVLHLVEDGGRLIQPEKPVLTGFSAQMVASSFEIASQEKEIKAVTYHQLKVGETSLGLETTIVFDV